MGPTARVCVAGHHRPASTGAVDLARHFTHQLGRQVYPARGGVLAPRHLASDRFFAAFLVASKKPQERARAGFPLTVGPCLSNPVKPLDVPRWIRHVPSIRTAAVLLAERQLLEGFGKPC